MIAKHRGNFEKDFMSALVILYWFGFAVSVAASIVTANELEISPNVIEWAAMLVFCVVWPISIPITIYYLL